MAQLRLSWLCMVLLSILYATACTQDLSEPNHRSSTAPQSEHDYTILHPRAPRLTTKIARSSAELRALSLEEDSFNPKISPYNYLGYSYKIGNGIIGHPENLGRPILNVEGILNDPSFQDYILFNRVRYAHSEVQAYDSYDNLAKDVTTTTKVEGGFALNFKLFTIGAKTTYSKLFNSFHSTDSKSSMGRLDLFYYDAKVQVDNLSYAQKKIGYSYLRRSFVESIYNSSMAEILEKQGPLVVFGYYTGGRATALYLFNKQDETDQTSTNKNINAFIGATFNWASDGKKKDDGKNWSAGASIGYDRGNSSDIKRNYGFSNVYNQVTLFGGSPESVYSSPAKDMANNFVNLSSWLNSLANPKNHAFVDVTNKGLVRLDQLLIEKNFRQKIRLLLEEPEEYLYLAPSAEEKETVPYIEIQRVCLARILDFPNHPGQSYMYRIIVPTPVLYTRFGDAICLVSKDEFLKLQYENQEDVTKGFAQRLSPIFECEIGKSTSELSTKAYTTSIPFDFSSKEIYRYKNPKTNIWYIYDKSTKSAFSFYDDDYIPEVYGIDRWFNSLPERAISMRLLAERYTIIGL